MSATVDSLRKLDGFLAAALVDSSSGMMLESVTNGNFPVEVAAAANTDVMQAKLRAMDAIDLGDDTIEDMLISLGTQYHLIRPLEGNEKLFLYLVLERSKANLAMARHELKSYEKGLDFS